MIVLVGATGFLGRRLVRALVGRGDAVVVLTRDPDKAGRLFGPGVTPARWDGQTAEGWGPHVDGASAVINLAGDSLSTGRWTRKKKELILNSRLFSGRAVVEAVEAARTKPRVLIQASAVGYYGSRGDEELIESSPSGSGFLAEVCRQWESSTDKVETLGVRRVVLRSGVVLGRDGGALPQMVLPFKFLVGGPVGRGRQWFSWIHVDDEIRAMLFLLDDAKAGGVYNIAAPGAIREKDFAGALGRALKRPHFFPVPAPILRLIFGEKAKETILVSQRVRPARLLEAGFAFRYPEAGPALEEIYRAGH